VLTLHDGRTDSLVAVSPSAGRLFRVHVCTGEPRTAVVGDLIRRIGELVHDWHVVVTATAACEGAADLNVHPAELVPALHSAQVRVGCPDGDGCHVLTGACSIEAAIAPRDPLAVRLALLSTPHQAALDLDRPSIEAAGETLDTWRAAVANWARSPGAPMAPEPVRAIVAAIEDDLDFPLALQVLHDLVADESVLPGAKFEAFAYADRLLGLDLARDIR
jgi:hypothetical protein